MASLQINPIEPPNTPTYTTYLPPLKYEKLPTPTSIRLLEIDRFPSIKDDLDLFRPITCSLVVKDLNDRPKYDALLYTWGDPLGRESSSSDSTAPVRRATTPFGMACNGQRVKADISEKGSQVQLMGRIYRECVLVHIWLGGYQKDTEDLQYVRQSLEALNWRTHEYAKYKALDMVDPQTWRVLGIRPITRKRARGMIEFFNRAWFKRSWIIQEELLAPLSNALIVLVLIPFQDLIGFMAFLSNTGWFEKLLFQMRHKHPQATDISGFFSNLERVAYSLGIKNYLRMDQSEATDPRDKVYASIGIAKNDATQKAAQIFADYSRSVESVYIDATKLIMAESKRFNLEVFSQKEDELQVSTIMELYGARVDKISLWKGPLLQHHFSASPNLGIKKTCNLIHISTNDVLELMASVPENSAIGPPTSVPSLADEFHERNGSPTVLIPGKVVAAQEQVSRYQSNAEVFWRTMLQDTAENKHPARDGCGKDIFKDMEDVILFEMSDLISDTTLNSMGDKEWKDRTDDIMREFTNLQILKGALPYGIEDTQNPKHFAGARNDILSHKEKGVNGPL
ncbi:hypothetical protein FANTH_4965 [Fusarium anthophilum]|uniref:Heterokaryon incompatibility domain-containing protein n=1 Tax=Fusarium anthophilum TaxID=48485 RepID=A0A8H4ZMZ5_9HYPO|nr:hypothetical protein FANTH_4965 [Fusarium anthophilum]